MEEEMKDNGVRMKTAGRRWHEIIYLQGEG
jgi:hypothetical protein